MATNKLAAVRGLTTSQQQHDFRATHTVALQKGDAVRRPTPPLPSDKQPRFTYGRPGTYRTAEEVRAAGPDEPPMKHVVQHAYQLEWVRMNLKRADEFDIKHRFIKVRGTKATEGHAQHAHKGAQPRTTAADAFKLAKFTKVPPKVTQYMTRPAGSQEPASAAGECAAEGELEGAYGGATSPKLHIEVA